MRDESYEPRLAAVLERLVPEEWVVADWDDVLDRSRPHSPRAPWADWSRRVGRLRLALVVTLLALVLAAVASATYLAFRSTSAPQQGGSLIAVAPFGQVARVIQFDDTGQARTVWRCPNRAFCGTMNSVSWAPNGVLLAFALNEVGGRSAYIGLHVLNTRTGADLHIPDLPLAHPLAVVQPQSILGALFRQLVRRLGCADPDDLAWSPDSRYLAYSCPEFGIRQITSRVYIINADGSGHRRLNTGRLQAFWPTWSPDGKTIAFATGRDPRQTIDGQTLSSAVYSVRLDGSHLRRIANNATAPSWSPRGNTIAYWSICKGVKLATPAGTDVTPDNNSRPCPTIGVAGPPAWSLDGTMISIATGAGIYNTDAGGHHLKLISPPTGGGMFHTARLTWRPGNHTTTVTPHKPAPAPQT